VKASKSPSREKKS